MPRTLTAPPTDKRFWRRLLRLVHPDQGGDPDLFVWVRALQEHVVGDGIEEQPRSARRDPPGHPRTGERVDFARAFDEHGSFAALTRHAVAYAEEAGEPYASLLRRLSDCFEVSEAPEDAVLYRQQHQGATYKQLGLIAHLAGMSKPERVRWYRIAESVPLSQRHAGHLIEQLHRRAA